MIRPSRWKWVKTSAPAAMLITQGSTIARTWTVERDVMAIGQRGQRDVGAGDAEDDQRQQPFRAR